LIENRRHVHGSLKRKAVELIRGRHRLVSGAVQLPHLHHVHGLNSDYQFLRTPKGLAAHHQNGYAFDRPVIVLDDVIQIFGLPQFNIKTVVSIDASNGRRVGTALVDGDLLC
jgi:hypothetical protein